ncbi:6-pyruvoyl tetrahydropterin synthase/QueD family protein [Bradyrhizobium sp. USDA 3650]
MTGFASVNRAALAVTRGHELKIRVAATGSLPDRFDERGLNNFCFDRKTALTPSSGGLSRTAWLSRNGGSACSPTNTRHHMKISQAFKFEAAHRLPNVPQTHRCHRVHGHSYRVEVVLNGAVDPHTGFVMDFFNMEEAFGLLIKKLDHHCLNDVPGLENPTAENIAIWIWEHAKPRLAQLSSVRVYETTDSWAEYDGPDR